MTQIGLFGYFVGGSPSSGLFFFCNDDFLSCVVRSMVSGASSLDHFYIW